MRDRLIELIAEAHDLEDLGIDFFDIDGYIADHLLENGVIVPPCKVGDKLYIVATVSEKVIECTIIGIWIYDDVCSVITDYGTIHNDSLGKSVFFTKEEAEQALKGGAE